MQPQHYGPLGSGAPQSSPRGGGDKQLYMRWFDIADAGAPPGMPSLLPPSPPGRRRSRRPPPPTLLGADGDGRLTGADAVKFFERSGLPRDQLAKVWAFSDHTRRGFLDFTAFVRALELVSLAQQSGQVSLEAYQSLNHGTVIPPPLMEGLPDSPPPASPPAANPFGAHAAFADGPPTAAGGPSPGSPGPSSPFSSSSPFSAPPPPNAFYFGGPSAAGAGGAAGGAAGPSGGAFPPRHPSFTKRRAPLTTKDVTSIADGLRKIYFTKVSWRGGAVVVLCCVGCRHRVRLRSACEPPAPAASRAPVPQPRRLRRLRRSARWRTSTSLATSSARCSARATSRPSPRCCCWASTRRGRPPS